MKYRVIPVTSFNQNCSLVWCEESNEAALIDPGGEINLLIRIVSALSVRVKKILLTHGHVDHVGGAAELSKHYKVPILGPHRNDEWLLKNIEFQCSILGFDIVPSVQPDYWLADNAVVEIGNFKFHIFHCPGHSPGHLVFWNQESKFIFMGDVLFRGGMGRTDLPGGNIQDLILSIRKLIALGDSIFFLPGHGPVSTLGYERLYNTSIKEFILF